MRIKYLGTAAAEGWPGVFCRCDACERARREGGRNLRTRSQAVIDGELLVDLPPDTYWHTQKDGLDLPTISEMLVTHSHDDHFYPRELTYRMQPYAYGLPGKLNLYGNETAQAAFLRDCPPPSNPDDLPYAAYYHPVEPFAPFMAGGYLITALLANHDKEERCYNYIIERDGKRLLYANDTGLYPRETWDYLSGRRFDLASMDCTTGSEKDGGYHMGIEDNIEMAGRLEALGCVDAQTILVATHFSHNGRLLYNELVERMAPHRFLVAYDGFEVEF